MLLSQSRRRPFHAAASLIALTCTCVLPLQGESYYNGWIQEYNPGATEAQFGRAVAMDGRGNVFVTGRDLVNQDARLYTAKYDSLDGRLVWSRRTLASVNNDFEGLSIATDSAGDVIVTGTQNVGGEIDFYTVKYNGATGATLWGPKIYNGTGGGSDIPVKVVVDNDGNVIVTGKSAGTSTGTDIVTIKYNGLTGTQIGTEDRYFVAGNLTDEPADLAVDSQDNIIIAGTVASVTGQKRFFVRKLDASLAQVWNLSPVNTGDFNGATGVAVDSQDNIVATGPLNLSGVRGYFTTKLNGATGAMIWDSGLTPDDNPPLAQDSFGNGLAPSVAIAPDDSAIVTGFLKNASGTTLIRTIKYRSNGFAGIALEDWDVTDAGLESGDSTAYKVVVDGAGNPIVVGESYNGSSDDIYFAKYSRDDGSKIFSGSYDGTQGSEDDGNGVAVDALGNFAVLGTPFRRENAAGLKTITTLKFNRFIAATGDALPNGIPGVVDEAVFSSGGTPAVADDGSVVAAVTFKAGKKSVKAILHEGGSSTSLFPAVQGQAAPVNPGDDSCNWVSFTDPVMAANGRYAFLAKVTGKKSIGIWSTINGSLKPALRKGDAIPGLVPPGTVSAITSFSMETGSLVALVKVSGAGATNQVIVRVDATNTPTVLLRSGLPGFDIGGVDYTVKKFSIFTPPITSPGDGRWHSSGAVIARASVFETANKKNSREAIARITNAAARLAIASTNTPAAGVEATALYMGFGLPAIGGFSSHFAFSATLAKLADTVSPANDAALVYSATGSSFTAFAREGSPTGVGGLDSTLTFAGFTDPVINSVGNVAFIGTVKGNEVGAANKSVLVFGSPTAVRTKIARTGEQAPARTPFAGDEPEGETFYASFGSFAVSGGVNGVPIFLAKLKGDASGKDNVGLFAQSSTGEVRRLLRTGDVLGTQTVKSMTILNSAAPVITAARSFNSGGVVVLAVTFTDRTSALLPIGIP